MEDIEMIIAEQQSSIKSILDVCDCDNIKDCLSHIIYVKNKLSDFEVNKENKNIVDVKEMEDIVSALKGWERFKKNVDGSFKLDDDGNKIKKPPPSDKTINDYINVIKRAGVKTPNDLNILNDFDKVKSDIEERLTAKTSRTTNYIAIVSVLSALNLYPESREKYRNLMGQGNKEYVKDNESGIISKKQEESFIQKKEFDEMVSKMEEEFTYTKKPNLDDKMKLQDLILIKLYQKFPVRNELATLKKIGKEEFDLLVEEGDNTKNYLIEDGGKMYISLNDYKTNKTFGENVLKLPPDIKKLFRKWHEYYNVDQEDKAVFINMSGEPMTTNYLTKTLTRITTKYIGKPISTRMIRKIMASDLSAEKNEKQSALAKKMGHSVGTQNLIYVKKKPKLKEVS